MLSNCSEPAGWMFVYIDTVWTAEIKVTHCEF